MNLFYIVATFILAVIIIVLGSYALWLSTFRNRAIIARQTGESVDSVIWVQDRFKVKSQKGEWIIVFKTLRMKTAGAPGRLWTSFSKDKEIPRELRLTPEEWKTNEMSKKIQRGLFLYESSEGELSPMGITLDEHGRRHFKVFTQDNKRWLINEIKDINDLTRNRTKDILLLVAGIVAIAALAVIFIFGIIYMNEQATKSLAINQGACTAYIDQIMNYTTTVQNAERAGWLSNIQNTVGG
jgi:hypothetical protein